MTSKLDRTGFEDLTGMPWPGPDTLGRDPIFCIGFQMNNSVVDGYRMRPISPSRNIYKLGPCPTCGDDSIWVKVGELSEIEYRKALLAHEINLKEWERSCGKFFIKGRTQVSATFEVDGGTFKAAFIEHDRSWICLEVTA